MVGNRRRGMTINSEEDDQSTPAILQERAEEEVIDDEARDGNDACR